MSACTRAKAVALLGFDVVLDMILLAPFRGRTLAGMASLAERCPARVCLVFLSFVSLNETVRRRFGIRRARLKNRLGRCRLFTSGRNDWGQSANWPTLCANLARSDFQRMMRG